MKRIPGTILFSVVFLAGLACIPAAEAAKNQIIIVNNCNNKIFFYYKCYDDKPWDQNTPCPSKNTVTYVEPGKKWSTAYDYSPVFPCKRIIVNYGRADRSCKANDKSIQAEFPEYQPKIFSIDGDCGGSSFDFKMRPYGGREIHY